MIKCIDHVALGVKDLDKTIEFFTETLDMKLRRTGTHRATGRRIAFLGGSSGLKIELVETQVDKPSFMHLALQVDDVEAEYDRLASKGLQPKRPPHELAPAKATTALLEEQSSGIEIQILKYAPDSPDL